MIHNVEEKNQIPTCSSAKIASKRQQKTHEVHGKGRKNANKGRVATFSAAQQQDFQQRIESHRHHPPAHHHFTQDHRRKKEGKNRRD